MHWGSVLKGFQASLEQMLLTSSLFSRCKFLKYTSVIESKRDNKEIQQKIRNKPKCMWPFDIINVASQIKGGKRTVLRNCVRTNSHLRKKINLDLSLILYTTHRAKAN